jgi:hypothetical protein
MKIEKIISILSLGVVGLLISGTLGVGSSEIVVFAQNVTGNMSGTNVTQTGVDSSGSSSLNDLKIDHAGGGFSSLQTDTDNQTWIATGTWDLVSDPSNASQSNSSTVQFNATIDMRRTDNSQGHEHEISEFKLVKSSVGSSSEGSNLVFNGTATIDTDVGLYSDVPVSIRLIDEGPAIVSIDTQTNEMTPQWVPRGGTISVLIDERVQDHFGNTPLYGDVREED